MSDTTSREATERRSNQTSSTGASLLAIVLFLLLALGGFGAYRLYTAQERVKAAALEAEQKAGDAEQLGRLQPYKVDAETGRLSPAESSQATGNLDPNRPADIGDFELTERSGRKVTNKDLLGQPWAVCFVFTRCSGMCLQVSHQMRDLQNDLKGAPVRLVTITVDPDYDTPEVLKNYADNFGAHPDRWLFLTGEKEYVYRLLRGYFLQFVQEMTGKERQKGFEVIHTDDVLHIDAQGRIVKRYHAKDDGDMILLRRALLAEVKQLAENPPEMETPEPALAEKPREN